MNHQLHFMHRLIHQGWIPISQENEAPCLVKRGRTWTWCPECEEWHYSRELLH